MLNFNQNTMKITNLFFAAFASLGVLASCSNDDATTPLSPRRRRDQNW